SSTVNLRKLDKLIRASSVGIKPWSRTAAVQTSNKMRHHPVDDPPGVPSMRKLFFDPFEFDSFSSEESLEIHIALETVGTTVQFHDLPDFVDASVGPGAIQ